MITTHQKNIATFIHLSTFTRFIFPFGNFIAPIVLWSLNKEKSDYIDHHGKQAINFQMSILIYALILGLITVPFFVFGLFSHFDFLDFNTFNNITINVTKPSPLLYIGGALGGLAVVVFILELTFILLASIKARDGQNYKYPLTINFIK
jgi:uncharacterized Tic20 family protein